MTIIAGVGIIKTFSQRVDFTVQLIDSPEEFIESITENRAPCLRKRIHWCFPDFSWT